MRPRICICCGEPITEHGNALSRNPNLCASCSSLTDGMDDSGPPGPGGNMEAQPEPVQSAAPAAPPSEKANALEPVAAGLDRA